MNIYTYDDTEFSEDEVIAAAKESGLDINSYINKVGIKKVGPGKKKPVAVKGATVTGPKSTVSKSVKPSSESLTDYFSNKIANEVTSKASFMKQTTLTFGEVVSGEEFDFKTAGKSPEYKKRQTQLLEKQKKILN